MSILDTIRNLGEIEEALIGDEFISPVFRNIVVVTQIKGLVHKLSIPKTKPGWYRIRPKNIGEAEIAGEADLMQIEMYLKRFPKVRIILIQKQDGYYIGIPLKNNSQGLDYRNTIPVYLADDNTAPFETIICGFDGMNLWFKDMDPSSDLIKSEYLRDQFKEGMEPEKIRYKGLSIEEKIAYSLRFNLDKNHREVLKQRNLKQDVEFAGGTFVKHEERQDHYSVTYKIDGQEYTSYISKDPTHQVLTAGICLEGGDKNFDLTSLITVIREGQRRNLIHRFHNTR
jgi:hypothetical protein